MKTLVMTVMALMVATVAVAEEKVTVKDTADTTDTAGTVDFTIHPSGNDNNGFDIRVRNRGTNAWSCNVEVATVPSIPSDKRQYSYDVRVDSSQHWVGGYSGTTPNLECHFKSVTCTKKH